LEIVFKARRSKQTENDNEFSFAMHERKELEEGSLLQLNRLLFASWNLKYPLKMVFSCFRLS
jgi:hypothetical protein